MKYNFIQLQKAKGEKKKKFAKAKIMNAKVSLKFATEMSRELKGLALEKALKFLENLKEKREFLPLRKYRKKVAHRKGESRSKVKSGRYPVKLAETLRKLLLSAKANALAQKMDEKKLFVAHIFASQGSGRPQVQPGGKYHIRYKKATHIEAVLSER